MRAIVATLLHVAAAAATRLSFTQWGENKTDSSEFWRRGGNSVPSRLSAAVYEPLNRDLAGRNRASAPAMGSSNNPTFGSGTSYAPMS